MINWTEEEYQSLISKKNTPTSAKHSLESSEVKKTSKYHNKKTKVYGVCFDSMKESEYFVTLQYDVRNMVIAGFVLQPKFILQDGNDEMQPIYYIADFLVIRNDGMTEVWDVKASEAFKTDVYKLKKKMFQARYPKLEIIEKY
jgi:hypothetical protein